MTKMGRNGGGNYAPGLIWTRKRRGPGRPALDRQTIVAAAIELLDEHGLEALSMRQLGNRLGSAATTLYWHVANKDELLDLAFDQVMGELEMPVGAGTWRGKMTALLGDMRALMLRHPWYVRLYGTRPAYGPQALRINAEMLTLLHSAGFSGMLLDHAHSALSQYVLGAAQNALSWRTWMEQPRGNLEAMRDYVIEATAAYPLYVAYLKNYLLVNDPNQVLADRFATGVAALLDGLESRLVKGDR